MSQESNLQSFDLLLLPTLSNEAVLLPILLREKSREKSRNLDIRTGSQLRLFKPLNLGSLGGIHRYRSCLRVLLPDLREMCNSEMEK